MTGDFIPCAPSMAVRFFCTLFVGLVHAYLIFYWCFVHSSTHHIHIAIYIAYIQQQQQQKKLPAQNGRHSRFISYAVKIFEYKVFFLSSYNFFFISFALMLIPHLAAFTYTHTAMLLIISFPAAFSVTDAILYILHLYTM